MNRLIYDYLYSKNITEENFKSSRALGVDIVIEVVFELIKIIDSLDNTKSDGFNFLGSGQVVGKGNYCNCLECRINAVKDLGIISTLYSDEIWLHNPFEKYLEIEDIELILENLTIDINVLFALRPLVESNLVRFLKSKVYLHEECFEKYMGISLKDHKLKYKNLRSNLEKLIIENVSFKAHVYPDESEAILITSKIDGICIEGNFQAVQFRAYNPIPELFEKVMKRKTRNFYKSEIKKFRLPDILVNTIINEIAFQETYSTLYDLNILTNKSVNENILNLVDLDLNKSATANKFIKFSIPYFKNANLKSLIRLREQEGMAFINFRKSMLDLTTNHKGISEKELEEYMDDIIRGNLNEIDKSIRDNKKFLKSEIGKNILMGGTIITIASTLGVIPASIKAAMIALGTFHSSKEFIDNAKKIIFDEHNQSGDDFYFIYKSMNY